MGRKSIFTTLFSVFLLIIIISIGATALYSITTFNNFIHNIEEDDLIEKTEILHALFPISGFYDSVQVEKFTAAGMDRFTRITIIDKSGTVLSDSKNSPEGMDNHLNRPEVVANINGGSKVIFRYSNTLKQMMVYYSLPLEYEGELIGFIRTSISVELLNKRVKVVTITISIISIILIFISIGISYMMAINLSITINSIKRVAGHYAKGEFNNSLTEKGPREFASLSKSINIMGRSLQERIFNALKQKNRYKSMLESMREPVIRLNSSFVIEEMNFAAETFFKIKNEDSKGVCLLDITGNEELLDFVKKSYTNGAQNETIVEFKGDRETHLKVHSSILYDGDKNKLGLLLVMNDFTEHVRLEEMRKEFVANVSHELRTPTTAIQGYIETLINNDVNKDQVDKFLGIIYSHSIRLNSIIDDLLALAGLEKSDGSFIFERFSVVDLISSAVNAVIGKAEKKEISIIVDSSDRHFIYAHPLLAEQALTNLLVNAIKYSGEGSRVVIKTYIKHSGTYIEVSDEGCGIPQENQEQIFERFYRVDRARSREQGGTGLGLSIVKRVMSIHGGEASLTSELNKGSVFRLVFPVK